MPLPHLLVTLIETGRWVHPGEAVLRAVVPFIRDDLVFLRTKEAIIASQSWALMGPAEDENAHFFEYRGSKVGERDLPWVDVEKTLFVLCNENIGDDCGVALDYRTGLDTPRVIASDLSGEHIAYHKVSATFRDFATLLGL